MFVFLELSRLGTLSLACKNKHWFPALKLSSLGHHPHSPGYGNRLHQPPKLWNQNCLFWIFLVALFCILSKQRPSDLWYLSMRTIWQRKVKVRFLSIALSESRAETLPVAAENLLGFWVDLAFLFSPLFIYEFLLCALGPFQVRPVFYPFLVGLVMYIFSYSPCQTLRRR